MGHARNYFDAVVMLHHGIDCLPWPHAKDDYGYGRMRFNGENVTVAHAICTTRDGPPPEGHIARHLCGKGHLACVNQDHVEWATPAVNTADKVTHGTLIYGESNYNAKLTEDQARYARDCSLSSRAVAKELNVSRWTIDDIRAKRNWKQL